MLTIYIKYIYITSPVTFQLLRTVNLQHQRIDNVDDRSDDDSPPEWQDPDDP